MQAQEASAFSKPNIIQNKALVVQGEQEKLSEVLRIFQDQAFRTTDGVAVRWTLDNARVLRNLGFPSTVTPSPILRNYEWPGLYSPMEHQRVTAEFLTMHRRCYLFNEQGTGKTASAIWASHWLLKHGKVNRVLVICPLSVVKAAWLGDMNQLLIGVHTDAAIGTREQRLSVIKSNAKYVVINYDAVVTMQKELAHGGFDLVICDEATYVKNDNTRRAKAIRSLVGPDTWVWMMTGTPIAQSPMDAYGIARICRSETVPKSMTAFKSMIMDKVATFKWVPKPEATSMVRGILQPAIRFTKEQCLDLPERTYTTLEIEMTKEQRMYYEKMRREQVLSMASGEVTAVNAGVLLNKLMQISSGSVYTTDGGTVVFDASSRLDAMMDAIHGSSHKVLVFATYKHSVVVITERLTKEGVNFDVIGGHTSGNKRAEIIDTFQTKDEPKVLVIQPRAASHGITLHRADTVIWYNPCLSAETYLQANDRVHRNGQKNPCTIIHLVGSPVEDKTYKRLRSNIEVQDDLLSLYKEVIEG
jgi:SNF2 family DNA or RNA helicase